MCRQTFSVTLGDLSDEKLENLPHFAEIFTGKLDSKLSHALRRITICAQFVYNYIFIITCF